MNYKILFNIVIIFILLTSLNACAQEEPEPGPGFNEATFKGLEWRGIGPALMSGRIADVEIDPRDPSTWYVAVGSGGVWKTENRGNTWQPLFDKQASYSIGDIAIDPSNPDTIWVGSGENVSGRHVGYGDGVYRSRDGGKNWENLGLADSEHIGMIVVDPRDSNTVLVAAQGPLWSGGGDRGLYRTADGGKTWTKVLGDDEYTGVTEVHMDPRNPDVLYAATHQRLRTVAALLNGGPGSALHKSTDGGLTWRKLVNGLPKENLAKIGLSVSPANPDTIYATIELGQRRVEFYRSNDAGESWEKRSDYVSDSTGPHYYTELFASPHEADHVYEMDNSLRLSRDGGATIERLRHPGRHGDTHALAFDPDDPAYLLLGTDGGLYESWDRGETWRFIENLPVTQFYKLAVDYDKPFYNVYGGTQDNSTQGGPSRTDNLHGIRNSDWFITVFADGHQPAVDPTNPDIVYSEWQQGNLVRYDRRNGEIVYIQPQPAEGEPTERFNWDAPILISAHDPARLYYASHRLWRSDNRGDSWQALSGDLTHARDRFTMPMMGQVWAFEAAWDTYAMSRYGTITSIAESPLDEQLLYVGTDDGRIQVSEDGGANWRAVDNLPGVPDDFFVNDLKADLHDPDTVYVLVDDHKSGDFKPYVLKSTDRGRRWTSISSNLPERHLAWRLVQDHVNPGLLFVGTEFGVFFSVDGGGHWTELAGGVPTISFRDLAIQRRENDLVGATFGRGFYILDDYTALRSVTQDQLNAEATLFPVRTAHWYIPRRPLGSRDPGSKGSQGDSYYVAPNPPFGAVFTYYLKEELKTAGELRKEADKKANQAGEDAPYPGFDWLREEANEDAATILFTVSDTSGAVIRRIEAPTKNGFQRVAWDLRHAASTPWQPEGGGYQYLRMPGPLAAPGEYRVAMSKRVNGVETALGEPMSFEVVSIVDSAIPGANPQDMSAFMLRLDELRRLTGGAESAIETALVETGAIKDTLLRSTADPALRESALAIENSLLDLQLSLGGDDIRQRMNESAPVSISQRLSVALLGTAWSTYGPTETHLESLAIAQRQFDDVSARLAVLLNDTLPALRAQLDAAAVPWTPGRGAPVGD
jgi:photosystem II stability/assembly factor-like uncharacterized protein